MLLSLAQLSKRVFLQNMANSNTIKASSVKIYYKLEHLFVLASNSNILTSEKPSEFGRCFVS